MNAGIEPGFNFHLMSMWTVSSTVIKDIIGICQYIREILNKFEKCDNGFKELTGRIGWRGTSRWGAVAPAEELCSRGVIFKVDNVLGIHGLEKVF
jgi:hypothetical protein